MDELLEISTEELLEARLKKLSRERDEALELARHYKAELDVLRFEMQELKRLVFGRRSERFVPEEEGQLALFDELEKQTEPQREQVIYERRKPKKKQAPSRGELPAHLPRKEVVIEPDTDTTDLVRIGEEITETLDYTPGRLFVVRRIRVKYAHPKDEGRGVIIGQLPERPIEKGIAEAGLLASVLVDKYVDHLPLYRQVQRFKREGITLPTSTVEGWVKQSADLLVPLYDRLCELVLESPYIQADETPIDVQDTRLKGRNHRGQFWVYHAPYDERGSPRPLVAMRYCDSRRKEEASDFQKGFKGDLQSDGYSAYRQFEEQDSVLTFGCMAHARRKFFEAKGSNPEPAIHVLELIKALYGIESDLREDSFEERKRARQERSLPLLQELKRYAQSVKDVPKSKWSTAVGYLCGQWERLVRYCEHGHVAIDNNRVENAIRPIALGKKNYLFAGSHSAAQRSALIYSLLGTCKMNEVNPLEYLSDVLGRIKSHPYKRIDELLPHRWKQIRESEGKQGEAELKKADM